MAGSLKVTLNGTAVGTFTNLPGDYNLFAFDAEYLARTNRPILSQSLIDSTREPLRIVPRTHTIAPPFFANLLPARDSALRSLISRQRDIRIAPDYGFLRALGSDLPGAVVISREAPDTDEPDGPEERTLPEGERPLLRFSLAGMQLKFSTSLLERRFHVHSTIRGERWIVKMPSNAFPRIPENEYAIMSLAKAIGLDVPPIELPAIGSVQNVPADLPALRAEEHFSYAIRRFDRATDGTRIHVEDFNQIFGQKPDELYDHRSSSTIASALATLCPQSDVDEFVRRLVFGLCIGNNDMHLKNWAIIYPDGLNARLAPMYDFVCTRVYLPNGELALTVGGERHFASVTFDALTAFARLAEIPARRVRLLALETVERVRSAWPLARERIADVALLAAIEQNFGQLPLMKPAMT